MMILIWFIGSNYEDADWLEVMVNFTSYLNDGLIGGLDDASDISWCLPAACEGKAFREDDDRFNISVSWKLEH